MEEAWTELMPFLEIPPTHALVIVWTSRSPSPVTIYFPTQRPLSNIQVCSYLSIMQQSEDRGALPLPTVLSFSSPSWPNENRSIWTQLFLQSLPSPPLCADSPGRPSFCTHLQWKTQTLKEANDASSTVGGCATESHSESPLWAP